MLSLRAQELRSTRFAGKRLGGERESPIKANPCRLSRQGSAERMTDGRRSPGGPSWTCHAIEFRAALSRKINL